MILIQLGFGLMTTNWIMSCVISTTYVVLINGETTSLFQRRRGLRQGCPLSPLLFILVMEGLRLLIKKGQAVGKLSCIKVYRIVKILHIFFIDDVLLMTKDYLEEWKVINELLKIFFWASGLERIFSKSTVHYSGIQGDLLKNFMEFFPYKLEDLKSRFQYQGYFLKFDNYKIEDWMWLISKFQKMIDHLCNRWLSLGGCYILIKDVLEIQLVYWMTIAVIPNSVLSRIR